MTDVDFMSLALSLASRGRGDVEPNPMVGCVVVRDRKVVAEGWHERIGGPHAERQARKALGGPWSGAEVFVTLEPCCHKGKRTPPCLPMFLSEPPARVLVASLDPNPQVSGEGVKAMEKAGIRVEVGLLGDRSRQLNAAFHARMSLGRPYVTLKWAATADGYLGMPGPRPLAITQAPGKRVVHALRSLSDAILVGVGTVLSDDPLLSIRGVPPRRELLRVILDSRLRLPISSQLVRTARQQPVRVYTGTSSPAKIAALESLGVCVVRVATDAAGRVVPGEVVSDLGKLGVTHLLVEGGGAVHRAFLDAGLADRAWVFRSREPAPEAGGAREPRVPWPTVVTAEVGPDVMTEQLNTASRAFFAATPSVDVEACIGMANTMETP